jgi:hypothetical protein
MYYLTFAIYLTFYILFYVLIAIYFHFISVNIDACVNLLITKYFF